MGSKHGKKKRTTFMQIKGKKSTEGKKRTNFMQIEGKKSTEKRQDWKIKSIHVRSGPPASVPI